MKTIVKEITWLEGIDHGWGNGYVVIPEGHFLHGMDYDVIHERYPSVEVHGGLTYSKTGEQFKKGDENLSSIDPNSWVIGFDTCHCDDNMFRWTKENVEGETELLLIQLQNLNEN